MKKKSEGKEEFDKMKISEDVLKTLTMEDLWNSPRLRSYVEKKISKIKTVRFIMPSMKEPLFICVSSSKKQLTP